VLYPTSFLALVTLGRDTESYADQSVSPGLSYTYRLCAYNETGHSLWCSEVGLRSAGGPEILLRQSSSEIGSGSGSYTFAGTLVGETTEVAFTIENAGVVALELGGEPEGGAGRNGWLAVQRDGASKLSGLSLGEHEFHGTLRAHECGDEEREGQHRE